MTAISKESITNWLDEQHKDLEQEKLGAQVEQLRADKPSVGELIKSLDAIREERRGIAKRDKELTEAWHVAEALLLSLLDEQGMKRASSDVATATVTKEVVPQIDDWDALVDHIMASGDVHLLQRRPAAAAFRELYNAGLEVPGVSPYTTRKISLRRK